MNKLLVYCLASCRPQEVYVYIDFLVFPIEIPKNQTILCYNSFWSYFKRSANIRSLKYQSAIDHLRSKNTKNRKPILSTGLLPTPTSEHDAHSKRSWVRFSAVFVHTPTIFFSTLTHSRKYPITKNVSLMQIKVLCWTFFEFDPGQASSCRKCFPSPPQVTYR